MKKLLAATRESYLSVLVWVLLLAGLYVARRYNYLLFHSLAEAAGVVIACAIFIVAWNSRRFLENSYLLLLGIAYLFVGGLDFIHLLAYKGMGVFAGYGANLSTQLWIAARYTESMSFLVAPVVLGRKAKAGPILVGYTIITFLLLGSIFALGIFPVCFIEGQGLTPFKIVSEYVICLFLVASAGILVSKRNRFDARVWRLLVASIVVTICSELAFTRYVDVFGPANVLGHFLKVVSFSLVYVGIVETGVARPFDLIFRKLNRDFEERLQFEALLSDISATFINLSAGEIHSRIDSVLQRIGKSLGVDRMTFWDISADGRWIRVRHSWALEGIRRAGPELRAEQFSWAREKVLRGEEFMFERLDDLPEEAEFEKRFFEREGTKSHITVPLTVAGSVVGALSFGALRAKRTWPDELVKRLRLIGEILESALARTQAEEGFRESEERFRLLYERSPLGYQSLDEEGRFIEVNRAWLDLLGYSYEEVIGRAFGDFLTPEYQERFKERFPKFKAVGETVGALFEAVKKDGSRILVEIDGKIGYDSNGNFKQTHCVLRDVTERRRAEGELRDAELRYRTVADFTYDWEYWERPDGTLEYMSSSCERVTGYKLQEFIDDPGLLGEIVHPEDADVWVKHRGEAREQPEARHAEFRILRSDGGVRWIEHACQPVTTEEGEFLGFRASNRDITIRKQTEEETRKLREHLAHVTRVTTLGELSASLAHELNQPLAAILSNAQAAQRFLGRDEPSVNDVREALGDIIADDRRAGEIIRKLRALIGKGDLEGIPLNVNDIVRETVSLMRGQAIARGTSLKMLLADELPLVSGDRVQLQQVILNLLVNAVEAMRDVEAERREVRIRTTGDDPEKVEIAVEDCGVGLDEDNTERMFEPLFTTKSKGLGMGLSICRSIIEAHEGRLWATSNPEQGATFYIDLPAGGENPA